MCMRKLIYSFSWMLTDLAVLKVSYEDEEDEDEEQDDVAVEECESEDEVEELLRDLYPNLDGGITHTDCDDLLEEEPNVEAKISYSLLKDFELPLY
ncbi:hypothetical protein H5410_016136 [Solanum commersonii]|uniref:Uncharacterized protein n=1 Tax=Solanum commersonii TaxID=4109 RepID=A0A9J5ZVS0_SOLCO|nr:hypothetical protein H5410_016136 [Solanum commersonii]